MSFKLKLIAERREEELYDDSQARLHIYQYLGGDEPTSGQAMSITCPICKRVSYHPLDISERYCGACEKFHDEMMER